MAQLKATDLLGELEKDSVDIAPSKEQEPKGRDNELAKKKRQAEVHGAGKASPYQSELREKLRQKEQFNFGSCPRFVVQEYERLQKAAKMNKREFLYHLLREAGADIPPYEDMDGRKL